MTLCRPANVQPHRRARAAPIASVKREPVASVGGRPHRADVGPGRVPK